MHNRNSEPDIYKFTSEYFIDECEIFRRKCKMLRANPSFLRLLSSYDITRIYF